jgi:hypothetical protein
LGQEAQCSAEHNGASSEGTARLEPDALYFKGQFRLKIPINDVRSVGARRGRLEVSYAGGSAAFDLGALAEKWMLKIRYPRGLLDKLGVKPESKVVVLGVSDESFRGQLEARTGEIWKSASKKNADLVFFEANAKEALSKLGSLEKIIVRNGVIWVIAPKGQKHIKESDVLAAGAGAGLVDTKVVSFSDTHTAHKFVIPVGRR